MNEYEFEEVRGLPGRLPKGEDILWQGAPDWRTLARRVFHVRTVAVYFGLLIVGRGVASVAIDGTELGTAVVSALFATLPALIGLGLLLGLAWWHARTTVYTITTKRVVLRYGIAVQLAINLPFKEVLSAALKELPRGHGEIPLTMGGTGRLAYLHLWPHARPLHIRRPEPMLRCVPNAVEVARLLTDAWAADMEARGIASKTERPVERADQSPASASVEPAGAIVGV